MSILKLHLMHRLSLHFPQYICKLYFVTWEVWDAELVKIINSNSLKQSIFSTQDQFYIFKHWGYKCAMNIHIQNYEFKLSGCEYVYVINVHYPLSQQKDLSGLVISSGCTRCGVWEESTGYALQLSCKIVKDYMVHILGWKFFVLDACSVCSNIDLNDTAELISLNLEVLFPNNFVI